jgi:hypothetical protein
MRWTRPNPRPAQFEDFHVDRLVTGPAATLPSIRAGAVDVLDFFCGPPPYGDPVPLRSSPPTEFVERRGG